MIEEIKEPTYLSIVTKVFKDYYKIIDTKVIDKEMISYLNLDKQDFAYPITPEALDFWYNNKNKKLLLLRKDFAKNNLIDITDFIIFSGPNEDELKKLNELSKKTDNIEDEDLKNEIIFEQLKEEKIRKLINKVFKIPSIYDLMNFIDYIDLTMYFASKQIFLNKDKEELFIEIIEQDDDELLMKFERFLNISLEVEQVKRKFNYLFDLKDEFNYLSYWDYENIDDAIKDISEKEQRFLDNISEFDSLYKKNKELYTEWKNKIEEKLKKLKKEKN